MRNHGYYSNVASRYKGFTHRDTGAFPEGNAIKSRIWTRRLRSQSPRNLVCMLLHSKTSTKATRYLEIFREKETPGIKGPLKKYVIVVAEWCLILC